MAGGASAPNVTFKGRRSACQHSRASSPVPVSRWLAPVRVVLRGLGRCRDSRSRCASANAINIHVRSVLDSLNPGSMPLVSLP